MSFFSSWALGYSFMYECGPDTLGFHHPKVPVCSIISMSAVQKTLATSFLYPIHMSSNGITIRMGYSLVSHVIILVLSLCPLVLSRFLLSFPLLLLLVCGYQSFFENFLLVYTHVVIPPLVAYPELPLGDFLY